MKRAIGLSLLLLLGCAPKKVSPLYLIPDNCVTLTGHGCVKGKDGKVHCDKIVAKVDCISPVKSEKPEKSEKAAK